MNYCEYCGGKLQQKKSQHYRCLDCQKNHYVNPKIATAIFLIESEGRLVFGLRSNEPFKGKLDCLGGFVDVGENAEESLCRELEEEASLKKGDINGLAYLGSVHDYYPWEGETLPVVSNYYVGYLAPGVRLIAGDDIAKLQIISIQNVDVKDFAWDGMREMFYRLKTEYM